MYNTADFHLKTLSKKGLVNHFYDCFTDESIKLKGELINALFIQMLPLSMVISWVLLILDEQICAMDLMQLIVLWPMSI